MNEELKILITAEIEGLKKAVQDAQKQTKDVADKGKKNFEAFGKAAQACGKAIVAGMKIAVAAIAAGAAALIGLAESTREYRTEQAKLKSVFESVGSSATQATTTYNNLYRVLGDSGPATEAAQQLAHITQNEQDLNEWTTILQGAFAEFGNTLPIEGLAEAANETIKTGEVVGSVADVINWANVTNKEFGALLGGNKDALNAYNKTLAEGKSREEAFTAALQACNDEGEREQLMRTAMTGILGESAANYEENAAGILAANEAQGKLTEGLAKLGEAVEPLITLFKSFAGEALQEIAPWIDTISRGLQNMVNGVDGGAYLVERGIGKLVQSFVSMVNDMLPSVITIGTQIIIALVQGLVSGLPQLVNTISTSLPLLITALLEIIPQLTGAILGAIPILLETVVAGVAQIIAGVAAMLPTIVSQIMAFLPVLIQTLIESIPILLEAAIALLMAVVQAIPQIIPPLLNALPEIVGSINDMLLDSTPMILDSAIELLFALIDAIPQIIPPLVTALPRIITQLQLFLIKSIPTLLAAGVQLFMALVASVPKIIPDLINALGEIVAVVVSDLVGELKAIMNFKWELPKLKMPHVKITGSFSLVPPKVPKFSIDWYARGGVFDAPTLFNSATGLSGLGENGAEAVVPLENNLGWLDKLAGMLDERMGGRGPVYLQVDGKTFGEISCDSINQLTRQRGKLAINMW